MTTKIEKGELGKWLYDAKYIETLIIDKKYCVCDGPHRDQPWTENSQTPREYVVVGEVSTTEELLKISRKIHYVYGSWIEVYENVIVLIFGGCS